MVCLTTVQEWLTSLCKICETEAEAYASTQEIFAYIVGEAFTKHCGLTASKALSFWIRNSFFGISGKVLFWHRVALRHFEEYVNSLCEAENSAAKTTNTGTKATFALDTTFNCLDYRAEIKCRIRESDIEKQK